ncbi:MAG: DUF92 domain-containing protein [Candidatus Heimdallarchaeaceae archaeon]
MNGIININFTILDFIGLGILFVFVLGVLIIAEILKRKELVDGKTTRKIVHLSVGNVVLVFPFMFSSVWIALIGPTFFIIFTYLTCPGSPIEKFRLEGVAEGHTYGTVFYAISLTTLVTLFFNPDPNNQTNIILMASFMPLVWGDGISAVIGEKFGINNRYTVFGGSKSLIGSWSAAFATFGSVTISSLIFTLNFSVAIYLGLLTGLITAIIETLTPKGFDNLAIPTANALVLVGLYHYLAKDFTNLSSQLSLVAVITALIVGLFLAIFGIIFKALTWDGAIAGFYFGVVILGLGSWTWGAMFFTFFIVGSLFTFIGKNKKAKIAEEFEKGGTARDSIQAMVNSIIPAILALISVLIHDSLILIMAGGALATSLGDTLATEIGSLSRNEPRLASKPWKKVSKGTPGGVSVTGLLASFIGALIIGIVGWGTSFIDTYAIFPAQKWLFIIITTFGGVVGAYIDSLFACTIQRLNRCQKCRKITEKSWHCGESTKYYKGMKFVKNDLVNLSSILIGAVFSALFASLIFLLLD